MKPVVICLVSLALIYCHFKHVESAKILGVFPVPSKSHFFVGQAIMKALHEAGHEITLISPFPRSKPIENWRDIEIPEMIEVFKGKCTILHFVALT